MGMKICNSKTTIQCERWARELERGNETAVFSRTAMCYVHLSAESRPYAPNFISFCCTMKHSRRMLSRD